MKQFIIILASLLSLVSFSANAQLVNKNKTIQVPVILYNQTTFEMLIEDTSRFGKIQITKLEVDTVTTGNVVNFIDFETVVPKPIPDEDYMVLGATALTLDRYIRVTANLYNRYIGTLSAQRLLNDFNTRKITPIAVEYGWSKRYFKGTEYDDDFSYWMTYDNRLSEITYIGTPEKLKGERLISGGIKRYMVFRCGDGIERALQIYTFGNKIEIKLLN